MKPQFQLYPLKNIQAKGWILHQLQAEMENGMIAHYDKIDPTVSQNLFADNKREHGIHPSYHKIPFAPDWWSGEHEGYWKDAFIRTAYYSKSQEHIERADHMVHEIIKAAQENDGYIGMYSEQSRYNQELGKDNGELWAQSRILLALLGHYGFIQEKRVLEAVEKAVKLTMEHYPDYGNYFATGKGGAIGHGLMLIDVLERLYQITGETKYADFVERMYNDYSKANYNSDRYHDQQKRNLLSEKPYVGHAVHTSEHIRAPIFLHWYHPQDNDYSKLYSRSFKKLKYHSAPTGTLIGNERVSRKKGTYWRHYEYCTIVETFLSLQLDVLKFGTKENVSWAEKIFFNAGQGNRLPDFSALVYLGADQRYHTFHGIAGRYRYAAKHLAAACCPLNGGRLMPSYVEGMWLKNSEDGNPVAMWFGPSELSIPWNGDKEKQKSIAITQDTDFPLEDTITFEMKSPAPDEFAFYIRNPIWANNPSLEIQGGTFEQYKKKNTDLEFWKIIPEPRKKAKVTVNFHPNIKMEELSRKGKFCVKRGPLYFTYNIPHELRAKKNIRDSGFYTYRTKLKIREYIKAKLLKLPSEPLEKVEVIREEWDQEGIIWEEPPLKLRFDLGKRDAQKGNLTLVPMGSTILRKFAFRIK